MHVSRTIGALKKCGIFGGLLALSAVACFAQSSSLGIALEGITTEVIACVKWLGILILIAAAVTGAFAPQFFGKLSGAVVCVLIALEASSLVAWLTGI